MRIDSTISRLQKISNALKKYQDALIEEGINTANAKYGSNLATKTSEGFKIEGYKSMFAEFGTGTKVDESNPLAQSVEPSFKVQPGSFSVFHPEGKKTWLYYIAKHGTSKGFKPSNKPLRGMYFASKRIREGYNSIFNKLLREK